MKAKQNKNDIVLCYILVFKLLHYYHYFYNHY